MASWPKLGEKLPRCPDCHRAYKLGQTHVCRPLKRSHRLAALTDSLPASPPRETPGARGVLPEEGIELEVRVVSELNSPGWNWHSRRARSRAQRRAVADALAPYTPPQLPPRGSPPLTILVTWTHWGTCDEHDSLRSSLKSIVDGIADGWLLDSDGTHPDDADPRIEWRYAQVVTRELQPVLIKGAWCRRAVSRVRIQVVSQ